MSAYQEVRELFSTEGGSLGWRSKTEIDDPPYHTALATAFRLKPRCQGNSLEMTSFQPKISLLEIINPPYPSMRGKWGVVETLCGNPGETMEILLEDKTLVEKEVTVLPCSLFLPDIGGVEHVRDKVKRRISRAKRVMLAGCISPSSALSTMSFLTESGFQGEFHTYDISPRPLDLINAYWPDWKELFPGISLTTIQADLTALEPNGYLHQRQEEVRGQTEVVTVIPEGYYDLVIMDVLGHYISDENFDRDLYILELALSGEGIAIVSDLEELEGVPSEKRIVGNASKNRSQTNIEDEGTADWINSVFGTEINPLEIQEIRRSMFPPPNHPPRTIDSYFQLFEDKELVLKSSLVPGGYINKSSISRVFHYMVFGDKRLLA